jgi:hypothetical protein
MNLKMMSTVGSCRQNRLENKNNKKLAKVE